MGTEPAQGMGFQLTAVGLLALVTGRVAVPWAFLVTGSRTWDNYRHHADVAHAYHRIVQGIPPERIISFQYNDVPTLSENPYPGTLFNKPSGKSAGVNVNSGFNKSYTGANVNKHNVLTAFGDLSFVSDPLSRFIGAGGKMSNHTQYSTVGVRPAHQLVTGAAPGLEQAIKELSHKLIDKMPHLVTVDESAGELQLERFGCYRELNALIDQLCAPILLGASDKQALPDLSSLFPIYHQVFYGISKHTCMKHYEVEAARVFK